MSTPNKLQRRSDGAYETQDGFFAVKIRIVSGTKDGSNWFEFKSSVMAPVTRIEWPIHAPFALLPQDEAKLLVRLGYAIGISDQEMDQYNRAIGAGGEPAPTVKPVVEPPVPKPDPTPKWVKPAEPSQATPEKLPKAQPEVHISAPVASEPLKPIVPPTEKAPNPLKPIEIQPIETK